MTVDPGCWNETLDPATLAQVSDHGVYVIGIGAVPPTTLPTSAADVDGLKGVPALAARLTGDLVIIQSTDPTTKAVKTSATWTWDGDNATWVRMTPSLKFG